MGRGTNFTRAEDDVIRIGLKLGREKTEIAAFLGRSRQSLYLRINKMKANGDLEQGVMDLGQLDRDTAK